MNLESTKIPIEPRLVLCNCPESAAESIAQRLVEERLAACVNIIPKVTSFYRWQGKLCKDSEQTLLIKTMADRLPALTHRIRELHPYSLPEVISLTLQTDEGEPRYLAWLEAETRSDTRAPEA